MKYMLMIYSGDKAWQEYNRLSEEGQKAGRGADFAMAGEPGALGGEQLQPVDTATTVRVEDGRTLTTDGPFPETKEALGGFYLFEADALDRAPEIPSPLRGAGMGGAIEFRPVVE